MTKNDILQTAFRVWGSGFYLKTSLADIAAALGVTKPALYRHFAHKNELLAAMVEDYFSSLTTFMKANREQTGRRQEEFCPLMEVALGLLEFYVQNRDYFIFMIIHVYGNEKHERKVFKQLSACGFDLQLFDAAESGGIQPYPALLEMLMCNIDFLIAAFFKPYVCEQKVYTKSEQAEFIRIAAHYIKNGFSLNKTKIQNLSWEKIEQRVQETPLPEDDACAAVRAAAKVIAESGPWDATMEKVAEKLGLSKSTLYSHFVNKKDMIHKVFLYEAQKMGLFAEATRNSSPEAEESLYTTVFSIAHYFRSRSDLLGALDHMRTRRLDADDSDEQFYEHGKPQFQFKPLFEHIRDNSGGALIDERRAEWILFLVVNTLMRRPRSLSVAAIPNSAFRSMFCYAALGLNGHNV